MAALALAVLLGASGCAQAVPETGAAPETGAPATAYASAKPGAPAALPADAVPDYQLGGGYDPAPGVTVVARDSTDDPAPGLYSICYVNGFQTQPGAEWPDELLLHEASGALLVDPGWPDEHLFDLSTAANRDAVARMLVPTIEGCAADGFQAVEFDNLDSYTRSHDAFTLDDAVAFATQLVASAHAVGLAAGQKNTSELGQRGRDEIGFDFAVTEECHRFDECAAYTDVFGDQVIDIEYTDDLRGSFAEVCADPQTPHATVLRDRDLAPAGDPGHVDDNC